MSNIYLKVTTEKNRLILYLQGKTDVLQVSFWRAPTQADIIDF